MSDEPRQRWEQPNTCLHDGNRITDLRLCDPEPRIVCAQCGARLVEDGVAWMRVMELLEAGQRVLVRDAVGSIVGECTEVQRLPVPTCMIRLDRNPHLIEADPDFSIAGDDGVGTTTV